MIYKFLCVILLVSASVAWASTSDWQSYQRSGHRNPEWDSLVEEGFRAYASGNLVTSATFLERAHTRGCNDGLVLARLAIYYEAKENYTKAAELFGRAAPRLTEQYPDHELTRSINEAVGRALFLTNKKDEALTWLQKSLKTGGGFATLFLLGRIYEDKGDINSAVLYYESALAAPHPRDIKTDFMIFSSLGRLTYTLKDYDKSLTWWERVLAISPTDPTANQYKAAIQKSKFKEEERKVMEEMVK